MNSGPGQNARGRTPKESRGSGGRQWENGIFNQVVPGSDPSLQEIVAVGTHLATGGAKKDVASGKGVS